MFWLGNFSFLRLCRLDGNASNSSSSAHRLEVLYDNLHWALVVVALEDSELASKKKRAGKTPGGMRGLVHRFHHMLSVEQRWLEIWSSLAVSGFAHKLAFSSTNISQPVPRFDQICQLQADS